jgi:HD-GYP domain-containing protein (c-di-GMP phosphodiesterase class II)
VLAIIKKERGRQFDPQCVDAFMSVYNKLKVFLDEDPATADSENEILGRIIEDMFISPS